MRICSLCPDGCLCYNKFMNNLSLFHRNDIIQYAAETYGAVPEYLWASTPDAAVFRHTDNRKWYALIMSVQKDRLGLSGTEPIDILNIKCDPILGSSLRTKRGFLPGYHMNHEKWLTILLDGTVEPEKIYPLLEMSFELTKSAGKKKTVRSKKKPEEEREER